MHFDPTILSDLFSIEIPYLEKILRTIGVYLALVLLLRLMGKRLMAQLNSLDLVVVLLLSNVVQNAIIGSDNSLIGGVVGAIVLLIFNAGLDRWSDSSPRLRAFLQGGETTIIKDGQVDEKSMRRLGMTHLELRTALREQGADDVSEVAIAVIEPGGQVVATLKRGEQDVSYDEMRAAVKELREEIRGLRSDRQLGHSTTSPYDRVDPYEGAGQMWSGNANRTLVDETVGLTPARALDVGAGEGADAIWLAQQGWDVTAVEPSSTAMVRARCAADEAGYEINWVEHTLQEAVLPAESFELVTCHYPALFRSSDHAEEHRLTNLVAPGGTLLVVTHADVDRARAAAHGFNPDDYLDHEAFRKALGSDWEIEQDERRPREVTSGNGAHQHMDLVLRARRRFPQPAARNQRNI